MISIYSDPHLGLNLASNTTHASRALLKKYLVDHLNQIVDGFDKGDTILCAGDFFHTHQNNEDVLHSSLWVASQTSKILAGNHDVVNIADRKGTLDIISTVFDTRVVPCKFGEVSYKIVSPCLSGETKVYMVPHHSTQDLFDDALEQARKSAEKQKGKKILVTHCNYDSPFIKDRVTLNLSQRKAIHLLQAFDYIVLGHEHNHKTDLDDRVIVVGSPHPTGFGDISDKFTLHFDKEGAPSLKKCWDKSTQYLECPHDKCLSLVTPQHQFIKLTGEVDPSGLHDLAKTIQQLWKVSQAFAIKSEVKILSGDATKSAYEIMSPDKITEIIELELKNSPELYALWKEILSDQGTAP